MTIASPSMSTNAVIMRTVSFPFILLFPGYQRGSDISNDGEGPRGNLVHRVVRSMVWRVGEIDHVDHSKPGIQKRNVIVDDFATTLLHENIRVSQVGSGLPDSRHDFRRSLEGEHLVRNAQILVADHIPQYSVERLVVGRWQVLGEVLRAYEHIDFGRTELPVIFTISEEEIDSDVRSGLFERIAERDEHPNPRRTVIGAGDRHLLLE